MDNLQQGGEDAAASSLEEESSSVQTECCGYHQRTSFS
jgi:hypothetical protein